MHLNGNKHKVQRSETLQITHLSKILKERKVMLDVAFVENKVIQNLVASRNWLSFLQK
jgi:hypothetical protein